MKFMVQVQPAGVSSVVCFSWLLLATCETTLYKYDSWRMVYHTSICISAWGCLCLSVCAGIYGCVSACMCVCARVCVCWGDGWLWWGMSWEWQAQLPALPRETKGVARAGEGVTNGKLPGIWYVGARWHCRCIDNLAVVLQSSVTTRKVIKGVGIFQAIIWQNFLFAKTADRDTSTHATLVSINPSCVCGFLVNKTKVIQ